MLSDTLFDMHMELFGYVDCLESDRLSEGNEIVLKRIIEDMQYLQIILDTGNNADIGCGYCNATDMDISGNYCLNCGRALITKE